MANIVQIKRSSVPGKQPNVADLQVGELAINLADAKLYSKDTSGNIISIAGEAGSGGANVTVSSSPPSSPVIGDVWVDSDDGNYYTYIDDGDSEQWVELAATTVNQTGGNLVVFGRTTNTEVSAVTGNFTVVGRSANVVVYF